MGTNKFQIVKAFFFGFFLFVMPVFALATDYNIGLGQTYTTIGAFPWSSLVAGDTVYIHAKDSQAPYYEHLYVSAALQGTEANPIKIIGVNDGSGYQPILDGNNSTTGPNFQPYGDPRYHSALGLLFIGPGTDYGSYPQWVEISNLTVRNYVDVTTTDENNLTRNNYSGSMVYIQGGKHITLENLTLTGGQDGVFAKDGSSPVEYITLKNSYVYDNGIVGDYLYHNLYTEIKYLTLEGNHFGPPVSGSPGNNIKDRGVGTVIRYNYIDDGGHLIDLVECQDLCEDHTSDPAWDETYVYGNVLKAGASGPVYLVQFGTGDRGANSDYWRKNLYFYDNTVIVERDQSTSYYVTLFQLSSTYQTVYMDNNIVHFSPETEGSTMAQRVLQFDGSGSYYADGNIVLGNNWITPGWTETRPGYTLVGSVTGQANIISPAGNDPGFVDLAGGNYRLKSGASASRAASTLPSIISSGNALNANLTPVAEYVTLKSTTVRASINAIGAYEYVLLPPTNLR